MAAQRYPPQLDEYEVVDTDVHIRVSALSIADDYLDEPHRSHAKGGGRPSGSWNRHRGGKIQRITVETAEDIRTGLCEGFGVDHPILNPSVPYLSRLPQPEYATALMRAYNDFLVDAFLDRDDDFYGLLQIAPQRPGDAAEEIDRMAGEKQVVGVYVVPLGPEAPMGDPRYDIIYEAAEDRGLAVAFHSGTNAFIADFPKQHQGFNQFVSIHTLGHVWGQMQTVVSLLEQGTPVKFPDLTFAFLEAGIGWLPGLTYRLNKEYAIRRDEMPLLDRQPEEYLREFYLSSQPVGEPMDRADMHRLLDLVDAPSRLMFSSDYPHWDFDNPSELFSYLLEKYDETDRERILGGNAREAFGL